MLLKCVPCLFFLGVGLDLLLTGLVPSWRSKGWKRWRVYGTDQPRRPESWLVGLGWAKADKPIAQGEFSESGAFGFHVGLGALFIALGLAGVAWIVVAQINN